MKKREKKVISITLLLVIVLAMLLPSISLGTTEEVIIKDANLKEEIKSQLVDMNNDGKITQEEMKRLYAIDIPEGVTDITGLEYAKNLGEITIQYAETMPDLSILKVEDLKIKLFINNEAGVKFDFLKNIQNFHHLYINSELIEPNIKIDFKSLAEIENLIVLGVEGEMPSNIITQIKGIKGLTELYLGGRYDRESQVIDLSDISNLTKLNSLTLKKLDIKNANEIGKNLNLECLDLEHVKGVSDLSAIANCNKLREVVMWATDLSDVSFLENKRNITDLGLEDCPIKNIKDQKDLINLVDTLPNLQYLYIDFGEIKIENLKRYNEMKKSFLADETNKKNVNVENSEKTKTEDKKETKKEKPTRIPQAGMNVVANVISILVATSVVILVIAFVKARRK